MALRASGRSSSAGLIRGVWSLVPAIQAILARTSGLLCSSHYEVLLTCTVAIGCLR